MCNTSNAVASSFPLAYSMLSVGSSYDGGREEALRLSEQSELLISCPMIAAEKILGSNFKLL